MSAPKHTERIPTHIAESYAGKGVVHGAWRDVVRDLATDLEAREQLAEFSERWRRVSPDVDLPLHHAEDFDALDELAGMRRPDATKGPTP